MEDTLLEKMAQLLIDISETNMQILSDLQKFKDENAKLSARIDALEAIDVKA